MRPYRSTLGPWLAAIFVVAWLGAPLALAEAPGQASRGVAFPGIVIERPSSSYPTQLFPVAGARVKVAGESSDRKRFEAEAVTDRVGSFVVEDIPPGSCTVTITSAKHDVLTETHVVKSGMGPPLFKLQFTGLPANEIAPIAGKVELNVLVRDAVNKDKPIAKAAVTLFDKNPIGLSFTANDSGRFDTILSPGQYRHRASASGYALKEEAFSAAGHSSPATSAALQNLTIYLQPTGAKLPPSAELPKRMTVELSNQNREPTVRVAPGAQLTVKVATYAGTGYDLRLVPPDRTTVSQSGGPTDEPMPKTPGGKGKVVVGQGTWKVYEFKVADRYQGKFQLKFQFGRGKVEVEYTLTVNVGS